MSAVPDSITALLRLCLRRTVALILTGNGEESRAGLQGLRMDDHEVTEFFMRIKMGGLGSSDEGEVRESYS